MKEGQETWYQSETDCVSKGIMSWQWFLSLLEYLFTSKARTFVENIDCSCSLASLYPLFLEIGASFIGGNISSILLTKLSCRKLIITLHTSGPQGGSCI
jgi:hypothetical protein